MEWKSISVCNLSLLGFEPEIEISTDIRDSVPNYLHLLDVRKFESVLYYLLKELFGDVFSVCWPIAGDKKRQAEFRIIACKKLEELHQNGILSDKLVKKSLIGSSLCNDDKHWQLIGMLSSHLMRVIMEKEGVKVPEPSLELVTNSDLAALQKQAFEMQTIQVRDSILSEMEYFDKLQAEWKHQALQWSNVYRQEIASRQEAQKSLDQTPLNIPHRFTDENLMDSSVTVSNCSPWVEFNLDPVMNKLKIPIQQIEAKNSNLRSSLEASKLHRELIEKSLTSPQENLYISKSSIESCVDDSVLSAKLKKNNLYSMDLIFHTFAETMNKLSEASKKLENCNEATFSSSNDYINSMIKDYNPLSNSVVHLSEDVDTFSKSINSLVNENLIKLKSKIAPIRNTPDKSKLVDINLARTPDLKGILSDNQESVNFNRILQSIERYAVTPRQINTNVRTNRNETKQSSWKNSKSLTVEFASPLQPKDLFSSNNSNKKFVSQSKNLVSKKPIVASLIESKESDVLSVLSQVKSLGKIDSSTYKQLLADLTTSDETRKQLATDQLYEIALSSTSLSGAKFSEYGKTKSVKPRGIDKLVDSVVDAMLNSETVLPESFVDVSSASNEKHAFGRQREIPRTPLVSNRSTTNCKKQAWQSSTKPVSHLKKDQSTVKMTPVLKAPVSSRKPVLTPSSRLFAHLHTMKNTPLDISMSSEIALEDINDDLFETHNTI